MLRVESGLDPPLVGFVLPHEIEADGSNHGPVYGCIVFSDATLIFIKGHIQCPVQPILYAPMFADRVRDTSSIRGQTAQL